MINLNGLSRGVRTVLKQNGPLISSAVAGIGVGVTGYLTARATFQAADVIRDHEVKNGKSEIPLERFKERTQLVWKLYIPPVVAGGSTVLCIFTGHRLSAHKALAAQAAFAVTERAYSEYREKVIDEFGEKNRYLGEMKDQSIRNQIAQDHVRADPPPKNLEVRAEMPGDVLCHEAYTGRYFMSSKQKLEDARNRINAKLNKHDYATLDDFYHDVKLRFTSESGETGWKPERQLELLYSTVESEDGRPCMSFEYNYVTMM